MYLYLVAGYTGFRAKELASLTPASFDIDGETAAVTVKATISERRERDVQPIRADVTTALREWLASKPADQPLWPGRWYRRAAEMLRADLTEAEIEYSVNGRVSDFHSLRSMYVTELVRSGSHPKIVQSLARNSTIEVTMQHYTNATCGRVAGLGRAAPAADQQETEAASESRLTACPQLVRAIEKRWPAMSLGDKSQQGEPVA